MEDSSETEMEKRNCFKRLKKYLRNLKPNGSRVKPKRCGNKPENRFFHEFAQTLPPALRQSILADMEDSQMAVLPPELAAEAQNLRREWEARNRQLMADRFFTHVGNSGNNALSSIIRSSMGRLSRYRHTLT